MARRAAKRKADALDESATANNKAIPAAAAEKLPDNDAKEPVATGPVAKEPVAKEPVAKEPVAKKPAAKKPVAKKPVAKKAPAVRARGAPKADATTTTTTAAAAAAAAAPLPLPPSTEAGSPKKAAAAPKARRAAPLPRITPQPSSRSSSRLHDKSASPLTSGKTEHPSKRLRASLKDDSAAEPNSSPKTKAKASPKTKTASKPTAPKPKAAPRAKPAPKPPKVFTTTPTERLDVFAFGTGEYGELGLGPQPNAKIVKRPRLNALLPLDAVGIVAIAYGGMHGVALSHDGKVYTWGVNDLGALGRITEAKDEKLKDADADSSDSEDEDDVPLNEDESTPKLVEFPEGTVITRIAAGDSATIAVTNTGLVYGWGTFRSNEGVLGFSAASRIQQTPALIKELRHIVDVCCGNDHALALDIRGKAWAWGNGQQNQLGRRVVERTRIQGLVPREVGIPRKKVQSIHSGSFHSFAVTIDGLVYSWGLNSFAQCGMYQEAQDESTTLIVPIPTRVKAFDGLGVVMLDGGDRHSIALTRDGDLMAWGRMDAHQVGIGLESLPEEDVILDVSGKPRCLIVPHKITETRFSTIASGSNHSIAISTEDGSAYSWGFGDLFQCGHGNPGGDVPVPTRIENTATQGVRMTGAACGGQVSVLAGIPAPKTNGASTPKTNGA